MNKILVTRASLPALDDYVEEIRSIWDNHWLTNMGPKHNQLCEKLKKYLGVSNLELLTNGHMALELSLQAFDLKGEVITTPFTFASTTHAIIRSGLKPVFCDINPQTFCIDANKIERLITKDTCAIMPVHVYGNICDVEKINDIAQKYGLKVIYDAAHTFGETYKNIGIGNFGDASCFSFHATKVFNTIEGGAVCFKDQVFGNKIYELKNFGIHGPESVTEVGGNAKMNEFSAAMGICNLRKVDHEIQKRKRITERYCERLKNINGIRLNNYCEEVKYNYAYFPVVFDETKFGVNRDFVFKKLEDNNIGSRKYFYPLTNSFECFKGKYNLNETPIAYEISKSVLTLPLYPDLSLEDVDMICDIVIGCRYNHN